MLKKHNSFFLENKTLRKNRDYQKRKLANSWFKDKNFVKEHNKYKKIPNLPNLPKTLTNEQEFRPRN